MDTPVPPPDPSKLAASLLAADLGAQPAAVQATLRYLHGRVAIDWGLLEVLGIETRPEGDRFVSELKAILNHVELP